VHRIWAILIEEQVPADPTGAAKNTKEDIAKRGQAKKHERVGLHTQDLNDLITNGYVLVRGATGRRREEILNMGKDAGRGQPIPHARQAC
jgi:hypothetical protein